MKEHVKYLIPQPGLLVHLIQANGNEARLPKEGAWMPWTGPEGRFWRRRVRDGSCCIGKPPAPKQPPAEAKVAKRKFKKEEDNDDSV